MDWMKNAMSNPAFHMGLGLLGSGGNAQGALLGLDSYQQMQQAQLMNQYRQAQMAHMQAQAAAKKREMEQAEELRRRQQEYLGNLPPEVAATYGAFPEIGREMIKGHLMPPQAKSTDDMNEYQMAVQQGFQGSFMDYMQQVKSWGAMKNTTNINMPKLPPGYMPNDPNDLRKGVKPIPGSPAEAEKEKAEMESLAAENQINIALEKAQEGVALIDNMLAHPGLEYAIGMSSALPIIPGTPAASFDAMAKQLEGKAFLEAFETLKGGGQITQIEGEKATAAIARLQRSQEEKEYKAALRELKNIYQRGLARNEMMKRRQRRNTGGWSVEEVK